MNQTTHQPMKTILRLLADIALLPVTGCIFHGNRDFSDGCNRPKSLNQQQQPSEMTPRSQPRPSPAQHFLSENPL
jgi:hypothetical protein